MSTLRKRSDEPELMDNPNIDRLLLEKNLAELDFFNRYSGGHQITLGGVKMLTTKQKLYSIADIGCGSGDTMKFIADWARKQNVRIKFIGVDFNVHAIRFLKKNCIGYPEISGIAMDYIDFLKTTLPADIYICSLFCHHLDDARLVELFRYFRRATEGFVINDIQRSLPAYYSAWVLTRLLNGSALSKNDGPLSVLRAFKKHELENLLLKAGHHNFSVQRKWPFRFRVVVRNI